MRKPKLFSIVLSLAVMLCLCGTAMAEYTVFANASFKTSSVKFSSAGKATFSATTISKCASIKVSSCTLQVKSGSDWTDSKALTTPAGVTDCSSIYVTKSYASDLTSGKTYRLKAVFNADGGTVTCYSGEISY